MSILARTISYVSKMITVDHRNEKVNKTKLYFKAS